MMEFRLSQSGYHLDRDVQDRDLLSSEDLQVNHFELCLRGLFLLNFEDHQDSHLRLLLLGLLKRLVFRPLFPNKDVLFRPSCQALTLECSALFDRCLQGILETRAVDQRMI